MPQTVELELMMIVFSDKVNVESIGRDDEKCSDQMKNCSMTAAKGTIENEIEREISTRFSFLRVASPINSLRDFYNFNFYVFRPSW